MQFDQSHYIFNSFCVPKNLKTKSINANGFHAPVRGFPHKIILNILSVTSDLKSSVSENLLVGSILKLKNGHTLPVKSNLKYLLKTWKILSVAHSFLSLSQLQNKFFIVLSKSLVGN